MPSKSSSSHHPQAQKQAYYLSPSMEKSFDPQQAPECWKEPYTIDDADLMFDGKPLNLLYEENRHQAEHHESSRGRSRQSKK